MRRKLSDISLGIGLGIFLILGIIWIAIPYNENYQFVTVVKNSDIYDEPIFLILHWETEDELQVGKPIKLFAEIEGLPYSLNETSKNIEIVFNEEEMNFFKIEEDDSIYYFKDRLTFKPDSNGKFISDAMNFRFIVPKDISIDYCDYNLPNCVEMKNIIHPAPHDLAVQLDTNRIGIGVSLVVASFSSIVVWSRLRDIKND